MGLGLGLLKPFFGDSRASRISDSEDNEVDSTVLYLEMMPILALSDKDVKATLITTLRVVNTLEINRKILIREIPTIKNENMISDIKKFTG